ADPDGSLWVGTQAGGVSHYDPVLDRFESFTADTTRSGTIADNLITALMLDHRGWLWVASAGGRLQWLDRATRRFLDAPVGPQAPLAGVGARAEGEEGG